MKGDVRNCYLPIICHATNLTVYSTLGTLGRLVGAPSIGLFIGFELRLVSVGTSLDSDRSSLNRDLWGFIGSSSSGVFRKGMCGFEGGVCFGVVCLGALCKASRGEG